jgi:hypothetical protein
MLEYILKILEQKVVDYEKELFICIEQIKRNNNFNEIEIIFEKIKLISLFLDNIYLSFNEELKIIINQRL